MMCTNCTKRTTGICEHCLSVFCLNTNDDCIQQAKSQIGANRPNHLSGGSRISRRGRGPRRGRGLPRRLRFGNFVCQNKRIGTLGRRAPGTPPPVDPPIPLGDKFQRWSSHVAEISPDVFSHIRVFLNKFLWQICL